MPDGIILHDLARLFAGGPPEGFVVQCLSESVRQRGDISRFERESVLAILYQVFTAAAGSRYDHRFLEVHRLVDGKTPGFSIPGAHDEHVCYRIIQGDTSLVDESGDINIRKAVIVDIAF